MGNNARRKERQRLKRRQKRLAARRVEALSPYRKFGSQGDIVACYVNNAWQKDGLAELLVLKRIAGGTMAFAAFLVDMWCVGLKDAWGRINVTRSDFDELVERAGERLEVVRIDPAAAWRIVAGGVRFCRRNGFRLPAHYERWTALLGDNAECTSADLSDFGIEGGKLRYVGTMEDLRKRLTGCRPEEFLHRKDVEFILGDGPQPWEADDQDDDLDEDDLIDEPDDDSEAAELSEDEAEAAEALTQFQEAAVDAVRRWCFANGIKPHPRLSEAVALTLVGALQATLSGEEPIDEEPSNEAVSQAQDNIDRLLSSVSPEEDKSLQEALDQIAMCVRQFGSPAEFMAAMGLKFPEP